VPRPAPAPGDHTREVLTELGYDGARIDALLADGAVR
jgi:crotonobetainyl-CoA:carnitine CoA-transferase CaiB-like acyl-CoA transferase